LLPTVLGQRGSEPDSYGRQSQCAWHKVTAWESETETS
jgi:hypothetical protein